MQFNSIPTITARKIGFDPKAAKSSDVPIVQGRIYGVASKAKAREDAFGSTLMVLHGDFQAICFDTPDITYTSTKCVLPEVVQDAIVQHIQENGETEFALEFEAVKATTALGFGYNVKALVPLSTTDAMENLLKRIPPAVIPTPAPKPAPAPAETAAPAKSKEKAKA